MNARTSKNRTINVVDAEDALVRDPRKLGTEVRKQSHGTSTKDLVFDPETGEFVIGQKGVSGAGDIVTQMTEDGFAARASPKVGRYNDATGEFEFPKTKTKTKTSANVPRYNDATGEFEIPGARHRAAVPRRAPVPRRRTFPHSPPRTPSPPSMPLPTTPTPMPAQYRRLIREKRGNGWLVHGNIAIVVGILFWFFIKPWPGVMLVTIGLLHKAYHFLERD